MESVKCYRATNYIFFFYVSKLDFYTKAVWQPYELKLNILPLFA